MRAPIEEVFDFFSKAENLGALTPPSLEFEILSPLPLVMGKGTLIDYRLKLMRVPFRWQSKIVGWDPPFCFIDEQVRGPYRSWHHEHRFEPTERGTRIIDELTYEVPGWIAEPLVFGLFVGPRVRDIFTYRKAAMMKLFPS